MQLDQAALAAELERTSSRLLVACEMAKAARSGADPEAYWMEIPTEPTFPVAWLGERLGLGETEQQLLWILIANELDPSARALVRELGTERGDDPTIDTLRRAVYRAGPCARAWRELGPDGRLRRSGLIEILEAGPEYRQTVKLARRVLALVHGEIELDGELGGRFDDAGASLDQLEIDEVVQRQIAAAFEATSMVIVQGVVGSGRRSLIAAIARQRGKRLLVIDGTSLGADREVAARQLRIVARECALFDAVPLIRGFDVLVDHGDDRIDLVERELAGRACFATTTRPIARRWRRQPTQLEIRSPNTAARARMWARALPVDDETAARLSTLHPLAPALIEAAGRAVMQCAGGGELRPDHVSAGICSVLDDRLAGLATRIAVRQTWDDLVLPDEQLASVTELLARVCERGRVYEEWGFADKLGRGLGVTALFSGPPGTGKTMCAGLIARALGTEIYQVDLSKLTSKWVGETEKNLASLFDAAEAGHAILLFDEADAVFGRRTEVKSSNDRHANHETNYLLQRLESFTGICILTTNHENAIDQAFRRRISTHVRFPLPEAAERARLWRALLPSAAPTAPDLPFESLGDAFEMSGGHIRNAVLRAAFLAADAGRPIDGNFLGRAAQLECESMGKVISRA